MAKQTGDSVFIGTYNGLCFYSMNGKYYVRASSPLSRKRVLTDSAFAGTRRYAQWLAAASPIASAIYREVPLEKRHKNLYRTITGKALLLLKAGVEAAEVRVLLANEINQMVNGGEATATKPQQKKQVYNKTNSTPLPQWPGLRMINQKATAGTTTQRTTLRRRQQRAIAYINKAPLCRGARRGREIFPCVTRYVFSITAKLSIAVSEKDHLIRGRWTQKPIAPAPQSGAGKTYRRTAAHNSIHSNSSGLVFIGHQTKQTQNL